MFYEHARCSARQESLATCCALSTHVTVAAQCATVCRPVLAYVRVFTKRFRLVQTAVSTVLATHQPLYALASAAAQAAPQTAAFPWSTVLSLPLAGTTTTGACAMPLAGAPTSVGALPARTLRSPAAAPNHAQRSTRKRSNNKMAWSDDEDYDVGPDLEQEGSDRSLSYDGAQRSSCASRAQHAASSDRPLIADGERHMNILINAVRNARPAARRPAGSGADGMAARLGGAAAAEQPAAILSKQPEHLVVAPVAPATTCDPGAGPILDAAAAQAQAAEAADDAAGRNVDAEEAAAAPLLAPLEQPASDSLAAASRAVGIVAQELSAEGAQNALSQ